MELKDTVRGMKSKDYKERFKAEYYQTKIRYGKLKRFVTAIEVAEATTFKDDADETSKPDRTQNLLKTQLKVMEEYLHILWVRAEIENIDL